MTREIELELSFGPRLAWLAVAALCLALPPLAATGDNMDGRDIYFSPTGMFQRLVTTGETDLGLSTDMKNPGTGATEATEVDLAVTPPDPLLNKGRVIIGGTTAASHGIDTDKLIVNGHMDVTGCIYLHDQANSVVTSKCNWCRASVPATEQCNPAPW